MRPFGISTFLCGFEDGTPHVYQTEPSGAMAEWKANAIGKKSKELREYLEKHYKEGMTDVEAVNLSVRTLLEIVESDKNIEICVQRNGNKVEMVPQEHISDVVKQIHKEKEEAEAAKKSGKQ